MNQKKQHYLLNKVDEASHLLRTHIEQDDVVRIISHNDADGLSAAGIICNAISRQNGKFHVTIAPRLREEILKKLAREKYEIFVFCDMGSSRLDFITRLNADAIVADHHQIIKKEEDKKENIVHINPHLFGVDGTRDISASGVSYLIVRGMGNQDLAGLALVGAFGDMQCQDIVSGFNKTILDDSINERVLEVHDDLKISYKAEESLFKSLAYSFYPVLPGISGDLEGSMAFLEKIQVSYGIKFGDLSNEERDILKEELIKINPKVFGSVYSIPNEIPPLRNVEDYSNILDACGKNKKPGVGLSICLGDREGAVEEALNLLKRYGNNLISGIEWIKREGSTSLTNIQYLYTEDKKKKSLMGTLSSLGLELGILDSQKPVLGMSRMDNLVKVSARTTTPLVRRGVNLGQALRDASKSFHGAGGGHNIAAGAVIPFKDMENFARLMDDVVGTQIK